MIPSKGNDFWHDANAAALVPTCVAFDSRSAERQGQSFCPTVSGGNYDVLSHKRVIKGVEGVDEMPFRVGVAP